MSPEDAYQAALYDEELAVYGERPPAPRLVSASNDSHRYKRDEGKPDPMLVPAAALLRLLPAFEHGASKYAALSWRDVPEARERYTRSLLRHALKLWAAVQEDGVEGLRCPDDEGGDTHLAHLAATALILLDLLERD